MSLNHSKQRHASSRPRSDAPTLSVSQANASNHRSPATRTDSVAVAAPRRPIQGLLRRLVAAASITATASVASAQWTVVHLEPSGGSGSSAFGVEGGQQVGTTYVGNSLRASLWSGSAATWVDLTPAGAIESIARAVGGGRQAGQADLGFARHASLWSGSASSWIDLHPPAADHSEVWAVGGVQQGGNALFAGSSRASLWSGTAASWVDLSPAAATQSYVYGMDAGHQVGRAVVAGEDHACMWSGTAASWVDLHPVGMLASVALDVDGAQQVGSIADASFTGHAVIWSGSAAAWTDLSPAGTWDAVAYAIDGGEQVGYVMPTGQFVHRASLWSGSAASWVDLHALLPANYITSQARAIWHDGGITYVAGFATDTTTGVAEALLWVKCASPTTYCTGKTNSLGCTPAISSNGSPSASAATPFDIRATQVLNNESGLLFYGTVASGAPFQGAFLCVKAPVTRTTLQLSGGSSSGNDCTGSYGYDFNAQIRSGVDPKLVAGAVVRAQYWARDSADSTGFGSSLTDALSFAICP